jgi:hypothetical protein
MIPTDPNQLPDDIAALKAMIVAARARKASADQQRLALEAEIAAHEAAIAQMTMAKAADAEKIGRERAIRPQTITRKNALFAGSDGGGTTWATIATPQPR